MTEELQRRLDAIDRVTLTPLVRRALYNEGLEVMDWECAQVHGGMEEHTSIHRFSGNARSGNRTARWSFILKVVAHRTERDDPANWWYWKREPLAYRSGLLERLPPGLAAPRCFRVDERPDGEVWIWLEDVADELTSGWPVAHYGIVARHLGWFNGAYAAGRSRLLWPWLSRQWLRGYVADAAPGMAQLRDSLDHPVIRRGFPGDSVDRVLRLWDERETFLGVLDRLPHTLCHFDAHRDNLFARRAPDGQYQTVAVDWAFVGSGAIGEEIVLLGGSAETAEIVFQSYLQGLRDAGWDGDPGVVRLAYTAASAMRWPVARAGEAVPFMLDESLHNEREQRFEDRFGEWLDRSAQSRHFAFGLADEARELMDASA